MKFSSFVILAGGSGTRMNRNTPKVLTPFLGKEMVRHIYEMVVSVDPMEIVLVVPKDYKEFELLFGDKVIYCIQEIPLGTGHAVQQAIKVLNAPEDVIVINGDMPNINDHIVRLLHLEHTEKSNIITFATSFVKNPFGYGRILRNSNNEIQKIVEESDLDQKFRQINEINAGLYVFNFNWLQKYISKLKKLEFAEFYLTDLIGLAIENKFQISTIEVDEKNIFGVNTFEDLENLENLIFNDRVQND